MEKVIVENWDDVDFEEQYELISEQTKYKIEAAKHRLDWAQEDDSVIDIVERDSGDIIGSVEIIERVDIETRKRVLFQVIYGEISDAIKDLEAAEKWGIADKLSATIQKICVISKNFVTRRNKKK